MLGLFLFVAKESVRQIKGKLSVEMELAESKMYGKRNL